MQESLERELRRSARSSRPLGGILLDIIILKQFNDSYGHEAGDIVLRELGGLLQSQIRGEDVALPLSAAKSSTDFAGDLPRCHAAAS